jgi:hypothetical protein
MNKTKILLPILLTVWAGAASAQRSMKGGRVVLGTWDASNAAATLPVRAVPIASTPGSCTANKELLIKTDAAPGQQLFICNGAGNGYVLLGGSGAGGGIADPGANGIMTRTALNLSAPAVQSDITNIFPSLTTNAAAALTNTVMIGGGGQSIVSSGCTINGGNQLTCPGGFSSGSAGLGQITLGGSIDGIATISPGAHAGTPNLQLPTTSGILLTDTSAATVTGKTFGPGNTYKKLWQVEFWGGVCQGSTGLLGFGTPTANAGIGNCIAGNNIQLGASQFTALGQTVQARILLPDDFVPGTTLKLDLRFASAGASGTVKWNASLACIANTGASLNPILTSSVFTGVTTQATPMSTNQDTLSGISLAGCAAGNLLLFTIGLDAGSSAIGTIGNQNLLSVRLTGTQLITTQ